jgi:hypothetical protein
MNKAKLRCVRVIALLCLLCSIPAAKADAVTEGEPVTKGETVTKEDIVTEGETESLFGTLDYILLAGIGGIAAWYLFMRVRRALSFTRISDLYSMNSDPDRIQAFWRIWIRIQIQVQVFDDKQLKKTSS